MEMHSMIGLIILELLQIPGTVRPGMSGDEVSSPHFLASSRRLPRDIGRS